jgi:hypothetical protein
MPKKTPVITAATTPTEARYPRSELWGLLRDAGCCASSSSDSVVNIGSGIPRPALFAVTAVLGRTPTGILPSVYWCRNENADGSVPYAAFARHRGESADTIREKSSVPEGPEVTKRSDFTHNRTNHELSRRLARGIGRVPQRGIRHCFAWPVARRSRYSSTSKAAVCRTFGLKRTTLIDFLAWIGWSAGLRDTGEA